MSEVPKEETAYLFSLLNKHNLTETLNSFKAELNLTEEEYNELKNVNLNAISLSDQFGRLNDFVKGSMAFHKSELDGLLFPVFVIIYIYIIENKENKTAKIFYDKYVNELANKYNYELTYLRTLWETGLDLSNRLLEIFKHHEYSVRICNSSFTYLKKNFFEDKSVEQLSKLIGDSLKIDVYEGLPRKSTDILLRSGSFLGESSSDKNDKTILYGNLKDPQLDGVIRRRADVQNGDPNDENNKKRKMKKESPSKMALGRSVLVKNDNISPDMTRVPIPNLGTNDVEYIRQIYNETLSLPRINRKRRLFNDDINRSDNMLPIPHNYDVNANNNSANNNNSVDRTLATVSFNDRIRLSREGIPLNCVMYTLSNLSSRASSIEFNEDCSQLAAGLSNGVIHLRSLNNDNLTQLKSADELTQIHATNFTPNLFESAGTQMKDLKGHSAGVFGLSWSTDKSNLLSASADGSVRLWSLKTLTNIAKFQMGTVSPAWCVDFAPIYSYYFAVGFHNASIDFYSVDSMRPLRRFVSSDAYFPVTAVKIHNNLNYVASGSQDRCVRLFDVRSAQMVRNFTGHKSTVNCLQFTDDGRFLISGADDGNVNIWDLGGGNNTLFDSLNITGGLDTTGGPVNCMNLCRDSQVLAVGRQAGQIDVWNLSKIIKTSWTPPGTCSGTMATTPGSDNASEAQNPMVTSSYDQQNSQFIMTGKRGHPLDGIVDIIYTKKTPVLTTRFNRKNMLCVSGVFNQI